MEKLIEDLIDIKQASLDIYKEASVYFNSLPEEREFARFLGYLADESDRYLEVLVNIGSIMPKKSHYFYVPFRHDANCKFLKRLQSSAETSLNRGVMTKENMWDFIIVAEFSTCTRVFFNLVNSGICSSGLRSFSVNIQLHLSYVERFLTTRMGSMGSSEKFKTFYQSANMTLLAG